MEQKQANNIYIGDVSADSDFYCERWEG